MGTRSRPLRADALRNREHLLKVARQVFAEEGLGIPIDDVAKVAGLGVGTVYRHFPTKDALFEAIVLDELERLLMEARTLETEPRAEAALVQFLEKYLAAGAAKRGFVEALSRSRQSEQPPPAIRKVFKEVRASLGKLLLRAQEAGSIRSDVGVDETMALLQGVSAALSSYAGAPEGHRRIWEVVLDGLRAGEPGAKPPKRRQSNARL